MRNPFKRRKLEPTWEQDVLVNKVRVLLNMSAGTLTYRTDLSVEEKDQQFELMLSQLLVEPLRQWWKQVKEKQRVT